MTEPAQAPPHPATQGSGSAREVAIAFLRLGIVAFGGPAAHIGMMQDAFVRRRGWLDEQTFLDYVGVTALIPGPNSTELTLFLGKLRAGWKGLLAAGVGFVLPAFLMVLLLAHLYAAYGQTPQGEWILYGIKPVVLAIIAYALWTLGRKAVKGATTGLLGAGAFLAYLATGWSEVVLILAGGLLMALWVNRRRLLRGKAGMLGIGLPGWIEPVKEDLLRLFLTFFKIGAILYGSGYVLLAFLYGDFVESGLLTEQQLLDAVAVGQLTPGPLFTAATFIGYLLAGVPGAIVATIGIFLPSFVVVAITQPFIPRMRASVWLGAFLDGVNVTALALMAAVAIRLGRTMVGDLPTAALAMVAGVLLIRFRVSTTWLILGGAGAGLLRYLLAR
jgi:chromate transporter